MVSITMSYFKLIRYKNLAAIKRKLSFDQILSSAKWGSVNAKKDTFVDSKGHLEKKQTTHTHNILNTKHAKTTLN